MWKKHYLYLLAYWSNLSILCFQSKALIPLQTEAHPETKQRVLTNYMFPQQPRGDEGKLLVEISPILTWLQTKKD